MKSGNLWQRIKIAFCFVLKRRRKNLKIMNCGICGSNFIENTSVDELIAKEELPDSGTRITWAGCFRCQRCGAYVSATEIWERRAKKND